MKTSQEKIVDFSSTVLTNQEERTNNTNIIKTNYPECLLVEDTSSKCNLVRQIIDNNQRFSLMMEDLKSNIQLCIDPVELCISSIDTCVEEFAAEPCPESVDECWNSSTLNSCISTLIAYLVSQSSVYLECVEERTTLYGELNETIAI